MKELLYNKSEAVAALNSVDGFNPVDLARRIMRDDQEEQLYLDVKYRKLWFRLVHPAGKIVSRIVNFTESMAIVEARVYLDKCDSGENCIANSFSQKFRTDDPQFGDKFLEMAETAAIGRALADAGFGLQFADVGEENDLAQVDAGITVPYNLAAQNENVPMEGEVLQNTGEMPQMQTQPFQSQTMMDNFYQQAQMNGSTVGADQNYAQQQMPLAQSQTMQSQTMQNQLTQNQPEQTGQQAQIIQPQTIQSPAQPQSLDASLSVEELTAQMSYEQAVKVVIGGNGKYGGKTMGQVAVESLSSLNWFASDFRGNNHLVPAAARVILNQAMSMAG